RALACARGQLDQHLRAASRHTAGRDVLARGGSEAAALDRPAQRLRRARGWATAGQRADLRAAAQAHRRAGYVARVGARLGLSAAQRSAVERAAGLARALLRLGATGSELAASAPA